MGLGQDVLARLPRALACEWLATNGIGGSASGTAAAAITRASHALLASRIGGVPTATLLKLEERAFNDDGAFELACVVQPNGTARPAGHRLLESFTVDPWPTWRYRVGASVVEKSLMMVWEHDAVVVTYRLVEGPPVRLTTSPVLVTRPLHLPAGMEPQPTEPRGTNGHDASSPVEVQPDVQGIPGRVRLRLRPDAPQLTIWHNGAFLPGRAWSVVRHTAEDDRAEHAYLPGYVEATINATTPLHVVASVEPELFRTLAREARLGAVPPRTIAECVQAIESDERERLASWSRSASAGALETAREAAQARGRDGGVETLQPERAVTLLARALDQGLARRAGRLTIADPFPRGDESGAPALRATLALLSLRSFDAARDIVRGHVEYLNEGRAPERFLPDGSPVYGDPEPGLWLVIAGERYARRSGDSEFARATLYPALEELMRFHRSGAPGGLKVAADGLLAVVEPPGADELALYEEELARRAAKPRSRRRAPQPPHPRTVKRAGLNALWYQANVAMAQLARMVGRRENAAYYLAWAHEHQQRFVESFWDEAHGCLFESIRDDAPVAGLSPSQLWAVSLAPVLLPNDRALTLLATIEHHLATPFGLRPAPGAEVAEVEWLGPWLAATLRAHGRDDAAAQRARASLVALSDWLAGEGLGAVPGTFAVTQTDEPPDAHGPASPVAAAALLRAWIEEIEHAPALAATATRAADDAAPHSP